MCHSTKSRTDGVLIVSPYYNKPTQEGIYQHFKAIDAASTVPIIVYNIPGRSAIEIHVETLARIFEDCPNVKGVKDATGNLLRPSLERMACGEDFNLLTGEDGTALGYMAHGGHGCISVTANVAPALCADFQQACLNGDFAAALKLQDRLMPLHRALFLETNPAGAKYALQRMEEWIGNGYVDIDPNSYNISPTALAAAITPGVKAIIVVHMHGISCDRDEIIGHARSRAFSSRTALRLMAHSTTGKHIGFCPTSAASACKELAPVRGRWRIHGDKQAKCAVIETTPEFIEASSC
nr:dihydrodipicolinate synthase family protein [Sinorhizobium meliloti]